MSGDVTTYAYYKAEGDASDIGTDWTGRAALSFTDFCPIESAQLVS
ncbi:hypothetical protein [Flavilitoribacter nigricans]|nr:hypothetical protein [Flavilitoribacter nigricans]